MDDKEIFIQAVDQAIDGGYDREQAESFRGACEIIFGYSFEHLTFGAIEPFIIAFLVDHKFAKAFFGSEEIKTSGLWSNKEEEWKVRLQEMVLEENYINYIKKYLHEKKQVTNLR